MAFSQVEPRTWALTATLVTIATVAAVAVRLEPSPQTPAFCVLAAAGVPLAFFDARTSRLPNVVTLPAYPVSLALLGAAAPFLAGGTGRFVHALTGLGLMLAHRATRKTQIPFGPFLIAATLAVVLASGA